MNAATPLVTLKNVSKRYGTGQRVIEIEALTLTSGRPLLLHGRNGSGKSTLLRVIAGISRIDSGELSRDARLETGRLGYLPQSGGLYPDLTVSDNLRLRRQLFGLPDARPESFWYVREFGLSRYLSRRVVELSGGFQRLAAIAATLHTEPTWLLLDEPLSGVDTAMRADLRFWLAELSREIDLFVAATPSIDEGIDGLDRLEVTDGRVT